MFGGSLFLVLFLLAIVLSNTAYPSRTSEFTSCFRGVRVAQSLVFFEVFCRSLFVLLSFGHCIVCSPYGFWLPLCYLLVIVLSVLLTTYDYPFVIFWPLYCLSSLQLMITPLLLSVLLTASDYPFVIFWHCIVCPPYDLWLPLCYLLAIVLSILLTTYDYPFVIFGHCIVCPPYDLWLPLCYLLVIVLSVLLTAYDYPFVIFWSLYCLSSLRLLITPLLSFGHCIVCPPYGFWLPLCYLLAIVLPVLLTAYDYPFVIFWPLYCLSSLRLMITPLLSFGHCIVCPPYGFWLPLCYLLVIVLSVLLTASDYPFVIFWPLYCLSSLRLLITPLLSFGHCIACPPYGLWLPLCYLLAIVLSILLTTYDYPFVIFWSLYCLSYGFWLPLYYLLSLYCLSSLRLLITPLLSFGHCIVCLPYDLWLPLCYLLVIVLSVLLTASDYPFVIFWPLYCLSSLRLMITPLLSFGHCIVCPPYGFWLPLCYLLVIVLSLLLTTYDYPFVIFWSLYCLSSLRLLITPLLSFGLPHCIVSPPYDLWLPLCYLLVIVLSVLLTASDYPFVIIFWSLYCLSSLRLMITPLLSFGHCIVCPPYGFWLPLCYLLAIVLPVLLTASDYPFVIFWPLYCLSSLRLLITPLLSSNFSYITIEIHGRLKTFRA